LRAVHAVQLELSLNRGLLEMTARGGERHLVIRRHRQVASETEGGMPLGKLDLSARGCLMLMASSSGDGKPMTLPEVGIGGA
jgi:hypothetical protein